MLVKVFVVEDEAAFITLYRQIFPMHGLELAGYATDGEEAIRKFGEDLDLDIVLIDYRLPHRDGLDTMKALHEKNPTLPVVFISADGAIRRKALESGALDFLLKPFTKNQLLAIIEKHARKR